MARRICSLVLLTLGTASCAVAAAAQAQDATRERVNRQIAAIAAHTAVKDALHAIETAPKDDAEITARLRDEMSGKAAEHRGTDRSQAVARAFVETALKQKLQGRFKVIREKNRVSDTELRQVMPDLDKLLEQAVAQHVATVFSGQYQNARQAAVAKQREAIDLKMPFPPQATIDAKLSDWERHRQSVVHALVQEAVPQNVVLFTENEEHAAMLATKVVDQIDLEYRNQKKIVDELSDTTVPTGKLTGKAIEAFVVARLEKHVAQPGRQGVASYGVFSTVGKLATAKAREVEAKRLDVHIASTPLSVRPDALAAGITADPAAHRTLKVSREKFADQMIEKTITAMVRDYVRGSADSQPDLHTYFAQLVGEANRRAVVRQRLAQKLDELLPAVRKEIAQTQKSQQFRSLDRWLPNEEQIVRSDTSANGGPANYPAAVAMLGASEPSQAALLQETEDSVLADVRQNVALGVQALRRQRAIVAEMEKVHEQKLEQDVRSGRPKDALIAEWQAEFKSRWGKESAKSQFAIFQQTTANIQKTVSKHYDDIKKRAADEPIAAAQRGGNASQTGASKEAESRRTQNVQEHRDTASQKTAAGGVSGAIPGGAPLGTFRGGNSGVGSGGGPGGDGKGDGSDKNKDGKDGEGDRAAGEGKADMLLVLQDATNGMCTASLERGGSLRVQFQPAAIGPSVTDIAAGVTPLLHSLLAAKAAESPKANGKTSELVLRFHLKVRSEAVRHLLGIELRQNLESTVAQWNSKQPPGTRAMRFSWSDGN